MEYAKSCVKPAYDYFQAKFDSASGELKTVLLAFKAARYFSPSQLNELKPTITDIDYLQLFPFIDANLICRLKVELPTYIAAAEDVSPEVQVADWWKNHENEIPVWAEACKLILLVQPSSAAAERVFSILQNYFTHHQQSSSFEDYVSVSVMLQYNDR